MDPTFTLTQTSAFSTELIDTCAASHQVLNNQTLRNQERDVHCEPDQYFLRDSKSSFPFSTVGDFAMEFSGRWKTSVMPSNFKVRRSQLQKPFNSPPDGLFICRPIYRYLLHINTPSQFRSESTRAAKDCHKRSN